MGLILHPNLSNIDTRSMLADVTVRELLNYLLIRIYYKPSVGLIVADTIKISDKFI